MTTWTSTRTLKGPLFTKDVPKVVKKAIYESALESIAKELLKKDERRKKKTSTWPSGNVRYLGAKLNVMEMDDKQGFRDLEVVVSTTLAKRRGRIARLLGKGRRRGGNPRTTGKSWARKNMAAVRGMARGKLDAAARRI
jgi:hypothetical protein